MEGRREIMSLALAMVRVTISLNHRRGKVEWRVGSVALTDINVNVTNMQKMKWKP